MQFDTAYQVLFKGHGFIFFYSWYKRQNQIFELVKARIFTNLSTLDINLV